ncbi:MAG: hypothetical protein GX558_12330 [Clostridiales bacterium]|nr:hypothetical protein [Clostridiales bacterium]
MELTLLGTGDANGTPALFCDCPVCEIARREGGREVRTRSAALIDRVLKIDHSTDAMRQSLLGGFDLSRIYHLLITHVHQDHFAPSEIARRCGPFAALPEDEPELTVYGPADVCRAMQKTAGQFSPNRVATAEVRAFEPFDAGGYCVTPLPSDHMDGGCLLYLIEKDGKSIFYGLDMGSLPEPTAAFLAGRGIDLFVLDCTFGLMNARFSGHMTLADCRALRSALLGGGAARPGASFVLSHFAPISTYRELCDAAPEFIVAYDGISITTEGRTPA